MKHRVGFILIVLFFTMAVASFAYSWLVWKLNQEDKRGVNFYSIGPKAECMSYDVKYSGSKNLVSSSDMNDGYVTSIDINNNCGDDVYLEFRLKVNKLSMNLKDGNFKYTLVQGDTIIKEDIFKDVRQEETLIIADYQLITDRINNYKLYLWIDDNNNIKNQNYQFDLNLYANDII